MSKIVRNIELEEKVKAWYKWRTGGELHLDPPITFNEKINWLKIYDSTPLKGLCADKYEVRQYVTNILGEDLFIPLLGVWEKFEDIDFDALPNQFVLKATHGSGWNIIVTDKNQFNREEARRKFHDWLASDYGSYSYELHYSYIKPRIIAEVFVEELEHSSLTDYRFFCYNGRVREVWVDTNSGTPQHTRSVFDQDFNKKDVRSTWGDGGVILTKPTQYERMVEIANQLSSPFVFVRVDLYEIEGKVYVGELTFTPTAGLGTYKPPEWGIECGNMLDLTPLMG